MYENAVILITPDSEVPGRLRLVFENIPDIQGGGWRWLWLTSSSVSSVTWREVSTETGVMYYDPQKEDQLVLFELSGGPYDQNLFSNIWIVNDTSGVDRAWKVVDGGDIPTIGTGMSLSMVNGDTGSSNLSADVDRIKASLRLILTTAKGEMPFMYDFGTRLPERLFDNVTDETVEMMKVEIQNAIAEQEPRVEVLNINSTYDGQHTVHFTIDYAISNTNIIWTYMISSDDLRATKIS